ncbi:MAG: phage tail protein I [Desulfovibrionaceae bacterium]
MADLLPESATDQERAISESAARLAEVPVIQRDLWNPATCPAYLLPWLAWALSVDLWDDAWPKTRKRAVIAASVAVHRIKGTPAAVEAMLAAMGFDAGVVEWPEFDGEPYTFKVATDTPMQRDEDYAALMAGVTSAKNTRSHLAAIVVPASDSGDMGSGGLAQVGNRIVASIRADVALDDSSMFSGGVARLGTSIAAELPAPFILAEAMPEYLAGVARLNMPITATAEV